jgi:hypothetical protein
MSNVERLSLNVGACDLLCHERMVKLPLHRLDRVCRCLRDPSELDKQEKHIDFVRLVVLRDPGALLIDSL